MYNVCDDLLHRPKQRNAWTEIMRSELIYCIEEANRLAKVRVIILTGDPEGRAFCFGADLNPASPMNPNSIEGDVPIGRKASEAYWRDGGGQVGLAIVRSVKPVICAMNGSGVGVGMTLPTACDVTICCKDAKVGFVFGKRGLTMECLSSYFLERCVGYKKAMELVLTGRVFKAQDAPEGLFNYVVPKDEVLPKALEIAAEMMETSGMSCMLNRTLIIRNGHMTSPEKAHLIESKSIYFSGRHKDTREGMQSFLEKRKANYTMDPFRGMSLLVFRIFIKNFSRCSGLVSLVG